MRVEEMALRSEIRQMLNEAGFNRNTLKDLVKEVLKEELNKAIKQAIEETNCDVIGYTKKNIDSIINKTTEKVVREKITDTIVGNYFKRMKVDVNINPIMPYKEVSEDKGEISDGYHTFNQLYHQRAILFATIVNQNKDKAWKSFKHSDGKYCFDSDGEWFIVGVDTPQGSYTYHYSKEYWDMFDCQELECGKEWDGHTEEDVTRLLSLKQQPNRCDNCTYYEEQDGSNCYECVKGMTDNFEAQSTNITVEMHPKEAIEILEHERDNDIFVTTEHRARIHQALTMGIKALKAQIKADECFNNTDSSMIRVNLESQPTYKYKAESNEDNEG